MHAGRRVCSVSAFRRYALFLTAAVGAAFFLTACGGTGDGTGLSGQIIGDGSSTVFPISEAVAEEFRIEEPGVDVVVGISGTGGGFSKFCNGEIDFANASRPIKEAERQACAAKGIEPVEFEVAYDGLSVLVNRNNKFVECLTTDELKKMWEPGSAVERWSDVRAGFPDQGIRLYGPGPDSGTFDYFTEVINGKEDASRSDYQASEDDNVLVQGIAGDRNALGYFGFAYYEENADKLKLLAVDGGGGCVKPSRETISDGTYKPLSRPLLLYVRKDALQRPEVRELIRFYLIAAPELATEVGYVPAPERTYEDGLARLQQVSPG